MSQQPKKKSVEALEEDVAKLKIESNDKRKATIGICWRSEGDPSWKGALWDHKRLQAAFADEMTDVTLTFAIIGGEDCPTEEEHEALKAEFPGLGVVGPKDVDLIVIPGAQDPTGDCARQAREVKIIKKYFGRKPMVLICGAVWRLAEALDIPMADVTDHCHARMVTLNKDDKVVHNALTQYTKLTSETIADFLGVAPEERRFACNSVHKFAPQIDNWSPSSDGPIQSVDEVAVSDGAHVNEDGTQRHRRTGDPWEPELCCESFVVTPKKDVGLNTLMGFLWHPEAFDDPTVHRKLLCYTLRLFLDA